MSTPPDVISSMQGALQNILDLRQDLREAKPVIEGGMYADRVNEAISLAEEQFKKWHPEWEVKNVLLKNPVWVYPDLIPPEDRVENRQPEIVHVIIAGQYNTSVVNWLYEVYFPHRSNTLGRGGYVDRTAGVVEADKHIIEAAAEGLSNIGNLHSTYINT